MTSLTRRWRGPSGVTCYHPRRWRTLNSDMVFCPDCGQHFVKTLLDCPPFTPMTLAVRYWKSFYAPKAGAAGESGHETIVTPQIGTCSPGGKHGA